MMSLALNNWAQMSYCLAEVSPRSNAYMSEQRSSKTVHLRKCAGLHEPLLFTYAVMVLFP